MANETKSFVKEATVTREMLADAVGSGSLPVLATPVVAALLEEAACTLAQGELGEGLTTVASRTTPLRRRARTCGRRPRSPRRRAACSALRWRHATTPV